MGNLNLPTNSNQLIGLGGKMYAGLVKFFAPLKLSLITPTQFNTNLTNFTEQDGFYNAQRSKRQAAFDTWTAAQGTVYEWLLAATNLFATKWGTRYSTEWVQAGFVNNTTGIPTKIEDRLGLALAITRFFTANPSYEVESLSLTAAHGTTIRQAALGAQQAVMDESVALNTISATWTTAYDVLVKGMRDLITNLNSVLAKDDPRWESFGLTMPSTSSTPGQPTGLSAHLDENGAVMLQNDATPLATRYRYRKMVVGVDTTYSLAASSTEPMASVTSIQPGQTVQFIVQAVNGSAQGVASDAITFTVLLPAVATKAEVKVAAPTPAAVLPMEEEFMLAARNGHGSANGNGHRATARVS